VLKLVFVYQGSGEQGEAWFAGLAEDGSEAAVADPDAVIQGALGVDRGGLAAMFGPGAVACGVRAVRKGHRIGRKVGDPWTLPLVSLVERGAGGPDGASGPDGATVVWEHRGRHAGDDVDPAELLRIARTRRGRAAPA
jgi:hypothetical protein